MNWLALAVLLSAAFLALGWISAAEQDSRAEFFRSCAFNGGFPVWSGPGCDKPKPEP